ncbi:MAG TPA: hypothetical protein VN637_04580 [Roseiarcus sp.]|nr:hypothetical protein [Roseiarcus sp.]
MGSNPATPTIPTHSIMNHDLKPLERASAGDPSRGFRAASRNLLVAAIAALGVAACASVQEYPLAPNMVRLDVDSPAAPFVRDRTLRRAAELTLENGYSAFRLDPVYVEAFDQFGVTVVMFSAGDPRAQGALDAADVLRRPSW